MRDSEDSSSTRPYLIRALHEWCTDNGFTPFLSVQVDESVRVPLEFVRDGEIVLNISFDATSALHLGNDHIEFKGRFGGVAKDVYVPVTKVLAIYARENGQGMAFPQDASHSRPISQDALASKLRPSEQHLEPVGQTDEGGGPKHPVPPSTSSGRPVLKRIK
ncbi:MAG: ClpXP protease specificity-enhancing factor [Rhodoferax sp.]|nr:ClpXP protease specificity-enhancing factor [Rhodoferax sp.]